MPCPSPGPLPPALAPSSPAAGCLAVLNWSLHCFSCRLLHNKPQHVVLTFLQVGWLVLQRDSPGLTHAAILSQQVGWAAGPSGLGVSLPVVFPRRFFVLWWSQGDFETVSWEPQGLLRPRHHDISVGTSVTFCESREPGRQEGREKELVPFSSHSVPTCGASAAAFSLTGPQLVPVFPTLPDLARMQVLQSSFPLALNPKNPDLFLLPLRCYLLDTSLFPCCFLNTLFSQFPILNYLR